ncbi:uroporphyrinogen-III C-methyltransferase [Bowmanella denitrificans]|uniref:uroporphyrinogen-III C-methyltransferase n=1 Tax=Bowmanella denitrificans TaxID=366582 RepID=UPI000C9C6525|nr:uroporphyrinogen-III C-methyltransferase [Bowmanella denitrificans]
MAKFLLLRPEGKCQASSKALNDAGVATVGLPLIDIAPDRAQISAFAECLSALAAQSKVLFVSTSAAELALQAMQGKAWPQHVSYFAVGQSTAAKLLAGGLQVQFPEQEDSEGLLALAELKVVNSLQALLVKGQGGRELIADTLIERGAEVQSVALYQRVKVKDPVPTQAWQKHEIQCIMATSGELLEAAFAQLEPDWLRAVPWILVSPRLQDKARDKGIRQVSLSRNASDEALIQAARQFMEQRAMADAQQKSTEVPVKPTSSPSVPKAPDKKTPANSRPATAALWLMTLLNLLLVLVVAAGGYWLWQQQQGQQQNEQRLLQEANQMVSRQESALQQKLDAGLQNISQQRQQSLQPIQEKQRLLEQQILANHQSLQDMTGRRPSDWLLAEADYLVRMAGRKLWLEKDAKTALLLLQNADARLADLADPSLLPVRQLLANDMQSVKQLDTETPIKISLELGALMAGVDALPLDMVVLPEVDGDNPANQALSDDVADWQANLQRSWRALVDDFITIRRRDAETRPLLSDKQQWLVKEQLRHYLMLAQQAVTREQSQQYRQAIEQAQTLLALYFAQQDNRVAAFAQALQQLHQTDIELALPERLQAAKPLEQLLEDRVAGAFSGTQS